MGGYVVHVCVRMWGVGVGGMCVGGYVGGVWGVCGGCKGWVEIGEREDGGWGGGGEGGRGEGREKNVCIGQ